MASQISTGAVHHVTLTVSDVGRAREFYTGVLIPVFQLTPNLPLGLPA